MRGEEGGEEENRTGRRPEGHESEMVKGGMTCRRGTRRRGTEGGKRVEEKEEQEEEQMETK